LPVIVSDTETNCRTAYLGQAFVPAVVRTDGKQKIAVITIQGVGKVLRGSSDVEVLRKLSAREGRSERTQANEQDLCSFHQARLRICLD
jgi:hypothetical protein